MDIIYSINTSVYDLHTQGKIDTEKYKSLALIISSLPEDEQEIVLIYLFSGLIFDKIFFCITKYSILKEYMDVIKEKDPYDVCRNSSIIVSSLAYIENSYNLIRIVDNMYPIDWSMLINNKKYLTIVSLYLKRIETNCDENSLNVIKYVVDKGNFINPEDTVNIKLMFQRYAQKHDQLKKYSENYFVISI